MYEVYHNHYYSCSVHNDHVLIRTRCHLLSSKKQIFRYLGTLDKRLLFHHVFVWSSLIIDQTFVKNQHVITRVTFFFQQYIYIYILLYCSSLVIIHVEWKICTCGSAVTYFLKLFEKLYDLSVQKYVLPYWKKLHYFLYIR